ncbi:MAG: serine/threonine-protein kinase [Cyanobacteriota bacterium]|nr:serine/threonine-protein kinase [Cyanobacteriota bacterium]
MNKKIFGSRYQVIYLLGKRPGFRTLLCSDIQTQQLVVVKFMVWDKDFQWENLKLFEREAQILQNISHPGIPKYVNYFEVNQPHLKGFALVQNYIQAASLEEHLQSGRTFSIEEVKQLAESVLEILSSLHSQKPQIIHRDIKPSNILLTNRSGNNIGDVYLVDFGSIKTLAASNNQTMTVVGTYGYMSPEHFGGKVIPTSDLYSLGATLIYIVTGTHPADLPQTNGRIQFEQLINCPQDFASWLKRMVEPVEELRFSSAKAALKALKQPLHDFNYLIKSNVSSQLHPIKQSKKPFGSKVSLKKSHNKLEILIPAPGIKKINNQLIAFLIKLFASAIVLPSVLFFIVLIPTILFDFLTSYILFLPLIFGIIYLLLWLGICAATIALIANTVNDLINLLKNLVKRERLNLNLKGLYLSSEYLCFKFPLPDYIPLKMLDRFEKILIDDKNSKWGIAAKLGFTQYQLADSNDLSETEVDWLCNELNEYLNLPIDGTGSREQGKNN